MNACRREFLVRIKHTCFRRSTSPMGGYATYLQWKTFEQHQKPPAKITLTVKPPVRPTLQICLAQGREGGTPRFNPPTQRRQCNIQRAARVQRSGRHWLHVTFTVWRKKSWRGPPIPFSTPSATPLFKTTTRPARTTPEAFWELQYVRTPITYPNRRVRAS